MVDPLCGSTTVKAIAETLCVARSNLVDQLRRSERRCRGPYRRAGDDELLAEIRAITDARPTYGYRRVTALLNRARRVFGVPPDRLMIDSTHPSCWPTCPPGHEI